VLSNEGSYAPDGGNYSKWRAAGRRWRTVCAEMVVGRLEAKDSAVALRHPAMGPDAGPSDPLPIMCTPLATPYASARTTSAGSWHVRLAHEVSEMIDDRALYIGSDNMYPVNLQE